MLPASYGTPSTKITAALLTGMSDATFIANGQFISINKGRLVGLTVLPS